jgi:hypothetical protein
LIEDKTEDKQDAEEIDYTTELMEDETEDKQDAKEVDYSTELIEDEKEKPTMKPRRKKMLML